MNHRIKERSCRATETIQTCKLVLKNVELLFVSVATPRFMNCQFVVERQRGVILWQPSAMMLMMIRMESRCNRVWIGRKHMFGQRCENRCSCVVSLSFFLLLFKLRISGRRGEERAKMLAVYVCSQVIGWYSALLYLHYNLH